ncbi:FHA domain-containing protein [bacterium]|nr:FHA domain-containing protein [bacterium]
MAREKVAVALVTQSNGMQERIILCDQDEIRLGRDKGNEFVISEPGVSRVHASLSASRSGVVITDFESLNGTFVNGVRIHGMRDVSSSEEIQIGKVRIVIELASDYEPEEIRSTRARAMTAQMRPIAVSVLVFEISVNDKHEGDSERETTLKDTIEEFDGIIDRQIGEKTVALWMGGDGKNQSLRAIRAFQRIYEKLEVKSGRDLVLRGVISSGTGLQATTGANASGGEMNLIGDPLNIAFALFGCLDMAGETLLFDGRTAEQIQDSVSVCSVEGVSTDTEQLFRLADF